MKCYECGKEISEGYLCQERKVVFCDECQNKYKMQKCRHDARGEHFHYKVKGNSTNVKVNP